MKFFERGALLTVVAGAVLTAFSQIAFAAAPQAGAVAGRPDHLQCDSLVEPLGLDAKQPLLSWQLQDARTGARQTAYNIQVATKPALLAAGKADVWDSGRVASGSSVDVAYAGPALEAQTRYYWRVLVWDQDGKPYPASGMSWWETGLMSQANWQAKWIGYEEKEEQSVRQSGAEWITNPGQDNFKTTGETHHAFRFGFDVEKPVRHAALYVTGKDSAAAWMNGKEVLAAQPLPPWKQAPWKTWTHVDVTPQLRQGRNLLAVDAVLYSANPNGMQAMNGSQTPMSVCLYVEMEDGSTAVFVSGGGWKAAVNPPDAWQNPSFDAGGWQDAVPYVVPASETGGDNDVGRPWPTQSVKLLRHSFEISKPVTSARLYVTALGAYQASINGHQVGDQILSPGWMDYRIHVPYQVYDVTSDVKAGKNAIGAYLAPGWYTTPLMWFRQGYNYGTTPNALRAQLRIAHADGTVEWITTDERWKADVSPILKAEIYDGETYDARRAQPGWDTATFSDTRWKAADVIQPLEPEIVSQYFQPIHADRILPAKKLTSPKPGVYIYDFGQNMSAVERLRVQGAAGTDVKLRFAEVLNPDGTLYTENLRTAKATDHYILAGKGVEEYQPRFTFHGFRYAEITGVTSSPGLNALQAVVIHTDAPFTAQLHTGSAMINQLWSNILWGQRSNFVGLPTDCPQRDERLGWTADAQVFWRAASYNMDLTQFSKKFSADLRGTQSGTDMYGIIAPGTASSSPGYGAGWSDAGVIIPWTDWLQRGDNSIIEENWGAMEKYLNAIESQNPDYLWAKGYGIPFGDWLSPEGRTLEPLVATAYWAYDVTLMREMAHALGKTEDEQRYAALFDHIRGAFGKAWVHEDGYIAGADNSPSPFGQINNPNAKSHGGDTQTSYVLALHMNLLPESLRQAAATKLVDKIQANGGRLGTGFLGTPYLLSVLVDTGHADVAYRLLLNTDYPSWGYLVGHGATTMWERWNGDQMRDDPSMNSYNHYAYGAVADWIYSYAAGIDASPFDPGFHTIALHPNFDRRLGSIDFSYESPYGRIRSAWSIQGNEVTWNVTIPPNATAQLPVDASEAQSLTLNGAKLADSATVHVTTALDGKKVYEFGAGSYVLKAPLTQPARGE
jgi:alpha-L-rhamnosidase